VRAFFKCAQQYELFLRGTRYPQWAGHYPISAALTSSHDGNPHSDMRLRQLNPLAILDCVKEWNDAFTPVVIEGKTGYLFKVDILIWINRNRVGGSYDAYTCNGFLTPTPSNRENSKFRAMRH